MSEDALYKFQEDFISMLLQYAGEEIADIAGNKKKLTKSKMSEVLIMLMINQIYFSQVFAGLEEKLDKLPEFLVGSLKDDIIKIYSELEDKLESYDQQLEEFQIRVVAAFDDLRSLEKQVTSFSENEEYQSFVGAVKDIPEIHKSLGQMKQDLSGEISAVSEHRTSFSTKFDELTEKTSHYDEEVKKYVKLRQEIEEKESKIKQMKDEVVKHSEFMKKFDEQVTDLKDKLNEEKTALEDQRNKYSHDSSEFQQKMGTIESQLKDIHASINEEVKNWNEDFKERSSDLMKIKSSYDELSKDFTKTVEAINSTSQSIKETTDTIAQKSDTFDSLNSKFSGSIDVLETVGTDFGKTSETIVSTVNKLDAQANVMLKTKENMENISKKASEVNDLFIKLQDAQKELDNLQTALVDVNTNKDAFVGHVKRTGDLNTDFDAINKSLNDMLADFKKKFKKMKDDHEKAMKKIETT
ncbi:MAG: hypothetical protein ACXADA_15590 [Candidatus Hodarchaeales archaeon]